MSVGGREWSGGLWRDWVKDQSEVCDFMQRENGMVNLQI